MPTAEEFHAQLAAFSQMFDYDVTYLREMLDTSLPAYEVFASARGMSGHRVKLPVDAHAVACVTTMLVRDCGPCTQLQLKMAVQAGVARPVLDALLNEPENLSPSLRDIYDHVQTVAGDAPPDDARLQRLRDSFGAEGLVELGLAIAGSQVFPTLKRALGHAKTCNRASLEF